MKLDMGRAWSEATALVSNNKDVVGVVAGVFFFLPYLALTLLLPDVIQPQVDPNNPEAVLETLRGFYLQFWWAFLLISVLQIIGTLALFALLTDSGRPTVGEALKRGGMGLPTYIAAQVLVIAGIGLVVGLLAVVMPALIVLLIPVMIYVMIKFCLSAAVIGIEGTLNPIAVLRRSWQLTKGNSLRIFGFFFLLFMVYIVISLLVTLIVGVVFAAAGGQIELIGNGIVGSILNAVFAVLYLAVLAGIHRQLAGPSPKTVSETSE